MRPLRSILLFCLSTFLILLSCEKPVSNSPVIKASAKIFIEGDSLFRVNDTLNFIVREYAHLNFEEVEAISIVWTISEKGGSIIEHDFEGSKSVFWIPTATGDFSLSVRVEYPDTSIYAPPEDFTVYKQDFRKPYLGAYKFQRIIYAWTQTDSALRVNRDTSYFIGKVEPLDSNDDIVRITCGNGEETILGTFNLTWEEYFVAKLEFGSENPHPFFEIYDDGFHSRFRGEFVSVDSLTILKQGGGLGGGRQWDYYGSKIK